MQGTVRIVRFSQGQAPCLPRSKLHRSLPDWFQGETAQEKKEKKKKNLICFQDLKQPSVTWLRACFSETENPSGSCKDQNRARLSFEFETDTNRRVTRGAGGNQFFFPKTHDAPIPMGHSTQWLHG
jgi:hypothetical protein